MFSHLLYLFVCLLAIPCFFVSLFFACVFFRLAGGLASHDKDGSLLCHDPSRKSQTSILVPFVFSPDPISTCPVSAWAPAGGRCAESVPGEAARRVPDQHPVALSGWHHATRSLVRKENAACC
jgi:hypothetical protein